MDINQIRMHNYRTLLAEFKARADQINKPNHGLLTRFAEFAGVSPRYLSHINSGRKNIGDVVARELEQGFALPYGWMDNDHEGSPSEFQSEAEKNFQDTMMRLFRESPIDAQNMLMKYMVDKLEASSRDSKPKAAKETYRG